MIRVILDEEEMLLAVIVGGKKRIVSGIARRVAGRASIRKEHLEEPGTWDQEIESAFATLGVAKWLNLYWTDVVPRSVDVGGKVEVKWTKHQTGHLLLYPENRIKANLPFVQVGGYYPDMWITGWAFGHEAMQDRYWHLEGETVMGTYNWTDSWWMPMSDLRPTGTLPSMSTQKYFPPGDS